MFLAEDPKEGEGREHFTEEQLIVTIIDFFTGGSGTMSKKGLTNDHIDINQVDGIIFS